MVRSFVYMFIAVVVLGTIAVPGLGAFALVALPLVGLGFVWRVGLSLVTRGHSTDAVVQTRVGHFLGPGGPDDSFAGYSFGEAEDRSTREAFRPRPAPAPSYTRNGARPGVSVPRPVPVGLLAASTRTVRDEVRAASSERIERADF